ncbi:hypothetical protein C0J52_16839 [Blattella germanica]|nr:hypothetical protein C0J52_16839 [Blattella germanica]
MKDKIGFGTRAVAKRLNFLDDYQQSQKTIGRTTSVSRSNVATNDVIWNQKRHYDVVGVPALRNIKFINATFLESKDSFSFLSLFLTPVCVTTSSGNSFHPSWFLARDAVQFHVGTGRMISILIGQRALLAMDDASVHFQDKKTACVRNLVTFLIRFCAPLFVSYIKKFGKLPELQIAQMCNDLGKKIIPEYLGHIKMNRNLQTLLLQLHELKVT